jgi:hypothetical protein
MLLDRYRQALGKSKGRQSLYDHSMAVVEVLLRVAALLGELPGLRLDRLVFAAVIHDVGKLDADFQVMLEAASRNLPRPARLIKHEACTFDHDYVRLVEGSKEAIRDELGRGVEVHNAHYTSSFRYSLDLAHLDERAMEHIWAFAVTHHGLFYVSYEQAEDGSIRPRVRRQWTCSTQGEVRRITFVDLLVEYYPLGGFVMIGDLIASYCHEQQKDYTEIFGQARTLAELIELVTRYAPEIEASLQRDDPRDYGLAALLKLLAGGIQ